MNKKIFLAVTAAFLLNSTMAQAEVKTFDFTYSGAKYSNNINITGFITLDTSLITINYSFIDMNNIADFGMTVTGANSGNGVFTKSAYAAIFFQSTSPLDFSRELVGQVLTDGSQFGVDNAGGGFFTPWSRINTSAPNTYSVNRLRVPDVFVELVSLSSVPAVPEADSSAMLLMGAGVMGFIARRRKQAAV
jgi:hypothetical protein